MRSSLLALGMAFALLANVANAQPHHKPAAGDLARARALDKDAAKAYAEGRYNDAIRLFEEAHKLGGPPFELWNIAKCHLKLDQPEQAVETLERYLATPNLPADDRDEATQQLEGLKKKPSAVSVSSNPAGAVVAVDGKVIEGQRTPLTTSVPPGSHTITLTAPNHAPYTSKIEAKYGRAISVDGALVKEGSALPPETPERDEAGKIALRGSLGVIFPRFGEVGGTGAFAFMLMGSYRVLDLDGTWISVGGLMSLNGDSWGNGTGQPDVAPNCESPLKDPHGGLAFSLYVKGHASFRVIDKLRVGPIAGVGGAGYFVGDNVGGDVFVPSCSPSPGVRPALLLGAQIDYAVAKLVRLSAWPLTFQVQPAFDGTRASPQDTSGVWMRFGLGIGAGVDL